MIKIKTILKFWKVNNSAGMAAEMDSVCESCADFYRFLITGKIYTKFYHSTQLNPADISNINQNFK